MRITNNLKNKTKEAAKAGYTHIECVRKTHFNSRYSNFHSFQEIHRAPNGTEWSSYAGENVAIFQRNNVNAKTIGYQDLFAKF